MNKTTQLLSATLLCFIFSNVKAQGLKPCATTEMQQGLFDANPQLYQEHLKENARLEAIDKAAYANGYKESGRAAGTVYIIPVVFHVLHQYGSENISDAQIADGIRCLTEDFRKRNADTISTVAAFKAKAGDSEIEFRLAQKDPNGNCTNGIDRIVSSLTNVTGTSTSARNLCKLNPWPRANYLNVWVVKSFEGGIAGYAQFPSSGSASTDGVVLISDYIGAIGTGSPNRSHTLSHEVGHFLNLNHIWDCCNAVETSCTGSDGVTDTPATKGHNNVCPLTDQTCSSGVVENVQNFMDYSYCYTMFTKGQSTRMRSALTSATGERSSLWTTTNLTTNTGVSSPTALCKADFTASFLANANNTICQGNSLTFTDASWSGTPTGWTWSFPGGTPTTSTASSPVVQYNNAGTYDVALTVTNTSGTVSTTKTGYVVVNSTTADYSTAIYTEGFEGSAIPNADWLVRNPLPGGNTWTQTAVAAASGTKSVRIANLAGYDGYVDELVSPSINVTSILGTNPVLTFKVAHAQKVATATPPPVGSADKLQVYVSTNCGQTWLLRKTLQGSTGTSALSTAGVNPTWTAPTSPSQWVTQSVSLSSYVGYTNFYFMFRFTSNGGNNIYLDDINISGTVGIEEDETRSALNFNIYPNPIEENTTIGFNLLKKQKVEIKVYDVLGQEISTVFEGDLNAGEHEYSMGAKANLIAGIYFVNLTVGDEKFTKKLIVK